MKLEVYLDQTMYCLIAMQCGWPGNRVPAWLNVGHFDWGGKKCKPNLVLHQFLKWVLNSLWRLKTWWWWYSRANQILHKCHKRITTFVSPFLVPDKKDRLFSLCHSYIQQMTAAIYQLKFDSFFYVSLTFTHFSFSLVWRVQDPKTYLTI